MTEEQETKIKEYAKNQGLPEDWVRQQWRKQEILKQYAEDDEARYRLDDVDGVTLEGQVNALKAVVGSHILTDDELNKDINDYLVSGVKDKRPYQSMAENVDLFKRINKNIKGKLTTLDKDSDAYNILEWVANVAEYMANAPKAYKPSFVTDFYASVSPIAPGVSLETYYQSQRRMRRGIGTQLDTKGYDTNSELYKQAIVEQTKYAEALKESADSLSSYLVDAQNILSSVETPKLSSDVSESREAGGLSANRSRYLRQYVAFPSEGTGSPTQKAQSPYIQTSKSLAPTRRSASNLYTRVKTGR